MLEDDTQWSDEWSENEESKSAVTFLNELEKNLTLWTVLSLVWIFGYTSTTLKLTGNVSSGQRACVGNRRRQYHAPKWIWRCVFRHQMYRGPSISCSGADRQRMHHQTCSLAFKRRSASWRTGTVSPQVSLSRQILSLSVKFEAVFLAPTEMTAMVRRLFVRSRFLLWLFCFQKIKKLCCLYCALCRRTQNCRFLFL